MGCPNLSSSRWGSLTSIVSLLVCSVSAQDGSQVAQSKATANPGDVNLQVSRVYTFVDKTGLGHQHAIEGKLASGNVLLGEASSAGQLVFDMRSFDADTPAARRYIGLSGSTDESTRSKVNANMKGSDVLDVQKYPRATFSVSSALPTGQTSKRGLPTYEMIGNFTLHGTTKPIRIVAEVEQARGWLHIRGNFVISQTSYGITPDCPHALLRNRTTAPDLSSTLPASGSSFSTQRRT